MGFDFAKGRELEVRLVTVDEELLKAFSVDDQVLYKSSRPCVLLVELLYKGKQQTFAVPLRSNIPHSVPKDQFFALPTRKTTRKGNRHGIHYIKMIPVDWTYTYKIRSFDKRYSYQTRSIIDKNEERIIAECQSYLTAYEKGLRPNYCTGIDLLLERLKEFQAEKNKAEELTTV